MLPTTALVLVRKMRKMRKVRKVRKMRKVIIKLRIKDWQQVSPVGQRLQCCVHVAGVADVLQAGQTCGGVGGRLIGV